jgi:hypothetical protein
MERMMERRMSRGLFGRVLALFVLLLVGGPLLEASRAKTKDEAGFPEGTDITYQWNYSCPSKMACGFSCPGAGTANHATRLNVYLGKMAVNTDQVVFVLFYNYATRYVPRGNGFSLDSGLGTLACQVSGMKLDYFGPPKSDVRY